MRRALLVATLTLAAVPLHAQTTSAPEPANSIMLPVPPLPPIGLPLPHIGLPESPKPATTATKPDASDSETATPPRARRAVPPVVVFAPVIVGAETTKTPGASTAKATAAATRQGRTGTLTLNRGEEDGAVSVFVDGTYVGSTEQLGDDLTLEAGSHVVDVQADGHPAQRFTVRVAAGKTTTHDLTRSSAEGRATSTPASASGAESDGHPARTPIFIIAGCYAGNVPPVAATLPAGCDPARMTTLER